MSDAPRPEPGAAERAGTHAPGLAGVDRRWGDGAITVVVGEEAPLLRRQLVLALEAHPAIEVAAEALDADALVAAVVEVAADVVVVGARLPPEGGGAAITASRRARAGVSGVMVDTPNRRQGMLPLPGVAMVDLERVAADLADAVVAVAARRRPPG